MLAAGVPAPFVVKWRKFFLPWKNVDLFLIRNIQIIFVVEFYEKIEKSSFFPYEQLIKYFSSSFFTYKSIPIWIHFRDLYQSKSALSSKRRNSKPSPSFVSDNKSFHCNTLHTIISTAYTFTDKQLMQKINVLYFYFLLHFAKTIDNVDLNVSKQ